MCGTDAGRPTAPWTRSGPERSSVVLESGLYTWSAGVVEWSDSPEQKAAAFQRLNDAAAHPYDVVASEWKDETSTVMLLLEHHC